MPGIQVPTHVSWKWVAQCSFIDSYNDNCYGCAIEGELTKTFLFLFSLDQVSLISLLKYFPPKMSLT